MSKGGTRAHFAGVLRLIPYSGIQAIDAEIAIDALSAADSCFIEEPFDLDGDGILHSVLLPLDAAKSVQSTAPITHPLTGKTLDPATIYRTTATEAAAAFAGTWIPIPYLRFVGRDAAGSPRFDSGPENWVRVHISVDAAAASPIGLTIAFDTSLGRQSRLDLDAYLEPAVDDAAFGSTFFFVADLDDIGELLTEPWFEAWLKSAYRPSPLSKDAQRPFAQAHVAAYLTLLRLFQMADVLPEARFTDTVQGRFPVRVAALDLILDIGDVETTALLVDVGDRDAASTVGYAEALRLRDLADPRTVHEGPIPTAVEFDVAPFGDAVLSRASSRGDAFAWPSLVRIGHEARRLSLRASGTEGVTGLSNLRAFLLDDSASPGLWRQSTDDTTSAKPGPMITGAVLAFLGENGAPLGVRAPNAAQPVIADLRPAVRPRFSRASMLAFFTAELILHALVQANAAGRDIYDERDADVRTLRNVVVLAPRTLSTEERQVLADRVEQGLDMVWRGLGWEQPAPGIPIRPAVSLTFGGDLGTQIAFLHNEVSSKFQGRFSDMMRMWRRGDVAGDTGDVLRIASVAVGARTTSLSIVDYAGNTTSDGHGDWQPLVRVEERLPVGTDAVVQALIQSMLMPAIERALAAAGLDPARHFLDEITGRSNTSLLIEDPYFARRLTRKILWPAGHGLLITDAQGASSLAHGNRSMTLSSLVDLGGGRIGGLAAIFDTAALQAGARGFHLADVSIALDPGSLPKIIRAEAQPLVQQIARTVAKNACDLLLVGSDGLRLPAICDELLALLPVPAGRIIDLDASENASASDALGRSARLTGAAMLPAIASALDRRQQLDTSGLDTRLLRRSALFPPPDAPTAQRALASPVRDSVAADDDRGGAGMPAPASSAVSGRFIAYPLKGA